MSHWCLDWSIYGSLYSYFARVAGWGGCLCPQVFILSSHAGIIIITCSRGLHCPSSSDTTPVLTRSHDSHPGCTWMLRGIRARLSEYCQRSRGNSECWTCFLSSMWLAPPPPPLLQRPCLTLPSHPTSLTNPPALKVPRRPTWEMSGAAQGTSASRC